MINQAFILCGGLGTRLGSMVKDTPKPMLTIAGKPILEHTVDHLKKFGLNNIILGAGYKAEVVEKYFKDYKVSVEKENLGTAGALKLVEDDLDDNFVVVYGDIFIDFDISKMIKKHEQEKPLATILVRPSTHPWSADLIQVDDDKVTKFVTKHDPKKNYQNLGNGSVYVMSKKILKYIDGKSDFMKDIFPKALEAGEKIIVHELDGFVKDLGTSDRFPIVEKYLKDKKEIEYARNNPGEIKAVFLDRDGVINKDTDHVRTLDEVQLLSGVKEAIQILNDKGMKVIIVTNQPGIARGLFDENTVSAIHNKIQNEIKPAKIDAIYYCPHHPETHHGEGIKELRIACECRKPKPGMILQAKDDFKLKLENSIFIGDSFRDVEAGENAGIRTVALPGDLRDSKPDYKFNNLLEAVKELI